MDKEWLYQEYITKNRTTSDIARECGCKRNTIQQWLSTYKIKKPQNSIVREYKRDKAYQNREYLYEEHINKHRSISDIARENGVSFDAIQYNMRRTGVPCWSSTHTVDLRGEEENIIELYCTEKKSAFQISQIYSCSHRTILRLLSSNGINTRTRMEAQFNYHEKSISANYLDPDWLYNEHWEKGKSCVEIADELDVSPSTVRNQMDRLNVKRKNNAESKVGLMKGDKHPNWKGGMSSITQLLREYFSNNLAPLAAKRDNYTCQYCGKTHTILNIHHIVPFGKIVHTIIDEHPEYDARVAGDMQKLYDIVVSDERFTSLDNLITLCKECHLYKAHKYTKRRQSAAKPDGVREGSTTIESASSRKINE